MLPVWGNRLADEKYKKLYDLLGKTNRVKFYGHQENKDIIQKGYLGTIPFDGVSIFGVLQKHGIVLVIHSDLHNKASIPSGRIFEAAAASAVIISDENPFVKEHFKDSVYYIDTTLTSDQISAQIMNHVNTILKKPKKALKKAKAAHQIYIDKFLMTRQLLQLESMHNKRKAHIPSQEQLITIH